MPHRAVSAGRSRPPANRPIRLLIVDDSAVARAVFTRMVGDRPEFEIAATVPSAGAALTFIPDSGSDGFVLFARGARLPLPGTPLDIYQIAPGLDEVPMSCAEIAGRRIPCSGGGYFRIFPYPIFTSLMRRANAAGRPVIFYLHPWEIDPGQPRVRMPALKRFRHYHNLEETEKRLDRLLGEFHFAPVREVVAATRAGVTGARSD